MLAHPVWAALQFPTVPTAVDYRVATALCTLDLGTGTDAANSTALANYFNKVAAAGCGGATGPQCGDKIFLKPSGTYTGAYRLPKPGGTCTSTPNDNWVTIMTNPTGSTCPADGTRAIPSGNDLGQTSNFTNFAKFISADTTETIKQNEDSIHHYRFVCVQFDEAASANLSGIVSIGPTTAPPTVVLANYPDHISLEHVYVNIPYDFGVNKGLTLNGGQVRLVDSWIQNIKQYTQGDDNALQINCGPGPYLIQNNAFIDDMGETVFIGGGPQSGCATITTGYEYQQAKDILVQNNYFTLQAKTKTDDPAYVPPIDTAGTGTLSTTGTALTFSSAQSFSTNATTGTITPSSTTIDIGVDPTLNGFSGSGCICYAIISNTTNGAVMFSYLGTSATAFTTVAFTPSVTFTSFATGAGVFPIRKFVRVTTGPQANEAHEIVKCTSSTACTIAQAFTVDQSAQSFRYNAGNWTHKNAFETKGVQRLLMRFNFFENYYIGSGQVYDYTMTFREFGWGSDIELYMNRFKDSVGPSLSVGDPESGVGFGPSPYATKRVWIHHVLWDNAKSAKNTFTQGSPYQFAAFGLGSDVFGQVSSAIGGTITASACSGNGVTFTATNPAFIQDMVTAGQVINYINSSGGKATLTAFTDSRHVTGNVTVSFAAAACGAGDSVFKWNIGPANLVGTAYYFSDSVVFEHNEITGDGTASNNPVFTSDNGLGSQKVTNFVFRDNLLSENPGGSGGGFASQILTYGSGPTNFGTVGLSNVTDAATVVWGNNAYFGNCALVNDTCTFHVSSAYTAGIMNAIAGPTNFSPNGTAFHDPNQAGGNGGSGAVGFTNYSGGNYLLTGTYLTAAHDGTMIGPDIATLNRYMTAAKLGIPVGQTLNVGGTLNIGTGNTLNIGQ